MNERLSARLRIANEKKGAMLNEPLLNIVEVPSRAAVIAYRDAAGCPRESVCESVVCCVMCVVCVRGRGASGACCLLCEREHATERGAVERKEEERRWRMGRGGR
eukprot:893013-Rhodomonas_salina.1